MLALQIKLCFDPAPSILRGLTSYYYTGAAASGHLKMNSNVFAFRTLYVYVYIFDFIKLLIKV